jgi:hypothetical protein
VTRGQCVEIATGAPMPEGADAVVMVEETERGDGDDVRVFTPVYPRQNVGRQGADIVTGADRAARRATCSTRAASARSPRSASWTSRSSRGRTSPSSRPATRSSSPGRLGPGRSTTSTASRSADHRRAGRRRRAVSRRSPDTIEDLGRALDVSRRDVLVFSGRQLGRANAT